MNEDYPYTQLEYAKLLGLSKSGLISRRKAGKLDGEFIVKDNQYFYRRLRPGQVNHTPKKHSKRIRRRGVHAAGDKLNYRNVGLQQHNEMKMLLKLQKRIDPKLIDVVPQALALYLEQKKTEARSDASRSMKPEARSSGTRSRNYGSGIYDPRTVAPSYRSLKPKVEKKFSYYG